MEKENLPYLLGNLTSLLHSEEIEEAEESNDLEKAEESDDLESLEEDEFEEELMELYHIKQ